MQNITQCIKKHNKKLNIHMHLSQSTVEDISTTETTLKSQSSLHVVRTLGSTRFTQKPVKPVVCAYNLVDAYILEWLVRKPIYTDLVQYGILVNG